MLVHQGSLFQIILAFLNVRLLSIGFNFFNFISFFFNKKNRMKLSKFVNHVLIIASFAQQEQHAKNVKLDTV